jgi:hypothetical protein
MFIDTARFVSSSIVPSFLVVSPIVRSGWPRATSRKLSATVVRCLPAGAVAFDALGRKVADPRSGIYFVCEEPQAQSLGLQAARKFVVTR